MELRVGGRVFENPDAGDGTGELVELPDGPTVAVELVVPVSGVAVRFTPE